ncbi:MAG: NB-ARC domain-containing protein, partial [Cyanobacteria bacterium P01_F01_bin.86]
METHNIPPSDRSVNIGGDTVGSTQIVGDDNTVYIVPTNRPYHGYLCQAPALPIYYVPRPEVIAEVKSRLLRKTATGTLVVSAIHGLGGIGKSVLATAISYEKDVRDYFNDGILWVTLGQEPNLLSLLEQWIQALGDYEFRPTSPEAASSHLRILLHNKRMLLIVDDVWEASHAELFRIGTTGSCILITTREAVISGADYCDMKVMSSEQSMTLLQKALGRDLSALDKSQGRELAKAVGHLPLALELAAAQLEDGTTWVELLSDLNAEIARLENFDAPGTQFSGNSNNKTRNLSLIASFNLSLNRLPPKQLTQFTWLGLLPEDISFTGKMVSILLDITERQARNVLSGFKRRALLLSGMAQIGPTPSYRLHDIVRYLTRRLIQSSIRPHEIGDLAGLGLTIVSAHRILLDKYRVKTKNDQWHTLPDDGYIHSQLTWHFEKAEQTHEIHRLFREATTEGRNAWYSVCEKLGQSATFITNLDTALRLAKEGYNESSSDSIHLVWRYTLIQATLNNLIGNIPPNMIAGLVEKQYWTHSQGLANIQQIRDSTRRATSLIKIIPFLPETSHGEVLELTKRFQNEKSRAQILSSLLPYLLKTLFPIVLNLVEEMEDEENQALVFKELDENFPKLLFPKVIELIEKMRSPLAQEKSLSNLFSHLPETIFPKVFELIRGNKTESSQSRLLASFSPHLNEKQLLKALELAEKIDNKVYKFEASRALASYAPKTISSRIEEIASNTNDRYRRLSILNEISQYLGEDFFPERLSLIKEIKRESARVEVINGLVPNLPKSLMPGLLEYVDEIKFDSSKSNLLVGLAPCLPKFLLKQALRKAEEIQDESSRVNALNGLAPHLFEPLLSRALEISERILDEQWRATGLNGIAPYLSEELLRRAIKIADKFQDDYWQVRVLAEFAARCPSTTIFELWDNLEKNPNEYWRVKALIGTAPHLSQELFLRALMIVEQEQDESTQADILRGIAPYLPKELFPRLLMIVEQERDESIQADILRGIAPYLPKELFPRLLMIVEGMSKQSRQTNILSEIASHLPKNCFPKALELTGKIKDDYTQALSIGLLAPY